jgi:hypothetical protein
MKKKKLKRIMKRKLFILTDFSGRDISGEAEIIVQMKEELSHKFRTDNFECVCLSYIMCLLTMCQP